MLIRIPIEICRRLPEISCYNDNHYALPITIDKCNVLREKCNEDYDSYYYTLGNIINNGFVGKKEFDCDYGFDKCRNYFMIDTELEGVHRC